MKNKLIMAVSSVALMSCAAGPIQAIQAGDTNLSCVELNTQIAAMDTLIAENSKTIAGDVAKQALSSAVLHTGALNSVPFLGTVMSIAGDSDANNKEAMMIAKESAESRQMHLTTLAEGKGC